MNQNERKTVVAGTWQQAYSLFAYNNAQPSTKFQSTVVIKRIIPCGNRAFRSFTIVTCNMITWSLF